MRTKEKGGEEYIRKVNKGSTEYMAALLKENERLRVQLASRGEELLAASSLADRSRKLEQENRRLEGLVALLEGQARELVHQNNALGKEVAETRGSLARLEGDIASVERESHEHSEQFHLIEKQNNDLANLYVTSYRLHGTLDREEILQAIKETVINLIGSEHFAVFETDGDAGTMKLCAAMGIREEEFQEVRVEEPLSSLASEGKTFLAPASGDAPATLGGKELLAFVPLKLGERFSGAIALFSLLPQKNGQLGDLDMELFDLLANQAATALYCTKLHGQFGAVGGAP